MVSLGMEASFFEPITGPKARLRANPASRLTANPSARLTANPEARKETFPYDYPNL